MAASPRIVSLWRSPDKQNFLCSGLQLTNKHILTVKHSFIGWNDQDPVYVRLIDGVDGDVQARVMTRHDERDAAILELKTAVGPIEGPQLAWQSDQSYDGRQVVLRVIDPDSYGRSMLANYSIGSFDHQTGEYVISPDNARGHSGGVLDVDGLILGLLSRRTQTDPLCRAVAMHLLWSWIQSILPDWPARPGRPPLPLSGPVSPAYRKLVERVRDRVKQRLTNPGLESLVDRWGTDPLAGLLDPDHGGQLAYRLADQLDALHRTTKECLPDWRRRSDSLVRAIKDDCRYLLSELIKLAVNQAADESELGAVATADPGRLHLACRFGGTGDVVYCALTDLPHLLTRRDRDIGTSNTVHVEDLLPSGEGDDLRQEVLKKLWKKVMSDDLPGRIEGKDYDLLLARINRHRTRDGQRYLLAKAGQRDWCERGHYRDLADELRLALVLYEDGDCSYLLLDEPELIDLVREYLELLETL